jgi:phosphoribosyl 1,2-cyclic phosphodiesterase
MEVRFWGVRGSIAAPGPSTLRTGGNTSSVEVRCHNAARPGERTHILLDAGTGIRGAGAALLSGLHHEPEGGFPPREPTVDARGPGREPHLEITLLLSHLHWDHIQGLPFFGPLYRPHTRLNVYGPAASDEALAEALKTQMSAPGFPVAWEALPARISLHALQGGERLQVGAATVRCAALEHPGGVLGYRIEHDGKSVVYATDTEHRQDCADPALVALASDADVLIYDAMYTEAEYLGVNGSTRVGWGHSTWEAGAKVARAAKVGRYLLFHHDPVRSDEQVDALELEARQVFPNTLAAREGLMLELP